MLWLQVKINTKKKAKQGSITGASTKGFTCMNPLIVGFTSAPNSQRTGIYNRVMQTLSERMDIINYICDCEKGEKMITFESYYKAALRYMIKDIENRSLGREKNTPLILYKYTPYDIIAHCNSVKTINSEYQLIVQNMMITHMIKFPLNLVIYLDFMPYDTHDIQYEQKEISRLRIDNNIMKQVSYNNLETINKDIIENRVNKILEIITQKLAKN